MARPTGPTGARGQTARATPMHSPYRIAPHMAEAATTPNWRPGPPAQHAAALAQHCPLTGPESACRRPLIPAAGDGPDPIWIPSQTHMHSPQSMSGWPTSPRLTQNAPMLPHWPKRLRRCAVALDDAGLGRPDGMSPLRPTSTGDGVLTCWPRPMPATHTVPQPNNWGRRLGTII